MNDKIFISISACNELDLNQTIKSAIYNAYEPARLYFGIYVQSMDGHPYKFEDVGANVTYVETFFGAPLGIGLPRLNASLLSDQSQKFYLQIDAHMIFEKNWDKDLIDAYSELSKKYPKPVISTYVPWWYDDENGVTRLCDGSEVDPFNHSYEFTTGALKVDAFEENLFRHHIPVTGDSVKWSNEKTYHEHFLTSGHFVFSTMSFFMEILQDPLIVWGGDEPLLGLRAWTRGYNIFAIKKPIVWHKNKWTKPKENIADGVLSLDKYDWRRDENILDKKAYLLHTSKLLTSYARIKDIFLGDYIGYWGAPSLDSLRDYQDVINSDFSQYYSLHKDFLLKTKNYEIINIMYKI